LRPAKKTTFPITTDTLLSGNLSETRNGYCFYKHTELLPETILNLFITTDAERVLSIYKLFFTD